MTTSKASPEVLTEHLNKTHTGSDGLHSQVDAIREALYYFWEVLAHRDVLQYSTILPSWDYFVEGKKEGWENYRSVNPYSGDVATNPEKLFQTYEE